MDIADRATPTGLLPTPLTSLIGREREVAEIETLVRDPGVRLVTLTGPGGVGKTRLAIKAARQVIDAFPDGVHFADLSPVRDAALVASMIAQSFGLHGGSDVVQLLVSVIARRRVLLLVDNFEHVVEVAPVVAELLFGAPDLTVLVTSREPLRVSGEQEYPITPFALPAMAQGDPHDLAKLDAVRLFAERARAVLPSFAIAPDTANQVADICRRLDGLPLAIELAAARVKTLPPAALLGRLEQRLPLLTGTRRDAPERQQTMRDAIAWSYALLLPDEQALFRRLGVFVGGFTLDAAETVTGTGIDVLAGLSSLVDKSLVRQQTDSAAEPRYVMLETIREFALEHLQGSDEHDKIRAAHAAWCTTLGEAWRIYGDTKHQPEMAEVAEPQLDAEFDNVRAALTWLGQSGNVPGLARLAGAIWYYWVLYGPRKEGSHWIGQASTIRAVSTYDKTSKLWVNQGICEFAEAQGRGEQAIVAANECLVLARELNDLVAEATAIANIGFTALEAGDYDRAELLIQEAIQLNERAGHWRAIASDRLLLAMVAYGREDLEQAEAMYRVALAVHRQTNDRYELGWELRWLGLIQSERGDIRAAAASLQEALQIWRSVHSLEDLSEWQANTAMLAATCGESELGTRLMAAALTLSDALEYRYTHLERMAYQRTEDVLRNVLGPVAFADAWQSGVAMSIEHATAAASEFLDRLLSLATTPDRVPVSPGITARESDVLRLLVQGKSDREIADALFIGTRTVETHVSNLIAKLGVHNRTEAATLAIRDHLV
jgi:non-specific serine/threonine protein kinase